jgi:hypothetical protein
MRQYIAQLIKESSDFSDNRIKIVAVLYICTWFLHGVLDPGISYISIEVLELGYEANAIMRVPMQHGFGIFILFHIPLYLGLFIAYVTTIDLMNAEFELGKSSTYRLAIVGLLLLVGWGIWLNLNNIMGLAGNTG